MLWLQELRPNLTNVIQRALVASVPKPRRHPVRHTVTTALQSNSQARRLSQDAIHGPASTDIPIYYHEGVTWQ